MKVVIDGKEYTITDEFDVWHINSLGVYNGTWVRISTDPMHKVEVKP